MLMKSRDMLMPALKRLEDAAACLSIPQDVLDVLRQPGETMKARLTIRMDDGSRRSFTAWRCRYDDSRGPTKGGLRYAPDASADEVETLAFWMTIKCAVMNLPYGGGKGAVRVDPDTLSRSELERLTRAYVRAFACVIGPDRDIPAPDIATNATIMAWMADEYSAIAGRRTLGVVTGKPVVLGGSLGARTRPRAAAITCCRSSRANSVLRPAHASPFRGSATPGSTSRNSCTRAVIRWSPFRIRVTGWRGRKGWTSPL